VPRLAGELGYENPVSLRARVDHAFEYHTRPAAVTIRVGGPARVLSIAVNSRFQDSGDVARLVEEQKPDTTKPCPHCGQPVGDEKNIHVQGNESRLLVNCGGSGYDYIGTGCFNEVAWDPDGRRWLKWDPDAQAWTP
jgi:hypothetical protein